MKKIMIMGGFARAGKTTAVNYLATLPNVAVISTSELLHRTTLLMMNELCGGHWNENYSLPKNLEYAFGVQYLNTDMNSDIGLPMNGRDVLITVAEKVLVPVFGRQLFSTTVARQAFEHEADTVIVESIGGEEYDLMMNEFCNLKIKDSQLLRVNIRRGEEQSEADYRELLPNAIDVWNDGTIDQFQQTLRNLIEGVYNLQNTSLLCAAQDWNFYG